MGELAVKVAAHGTRYAQTANQQGAETDQGHVEVHAVKEEPHSRCRLTPGPQSPAGLRESLLQFRLEIIDVVARR